MSLTLEEIQQVAIEAGLDQATRAKLIKEAEAAEKEKKAEKQANAEPKQKNQFVVVVKTDANLNGKQIVSTVFQMPENDNPWEPWYDKSFGFVICADSEEEARQLAHANAGDENRGEFLSSKTADTKQPWIDPKYSTCVELTPAHEKGVVIQDFHFA